MAQSTVTSRIVRFGAFELDLGKAELRKHGLRIRIQQQPYQILLALIERPGEIVSRDELVSRLWPDGTFVDFESSLNAGMTRLRQTLSDTAENPRYVATITRHGYRFLMPVEPLPASRTAAVSEPRAVRPAPQWSSRRKALLLASLCLLAMAPLYLIWRPASAPALRAGYVQITDFTDSAIAPALSPDGRTVAFIRSADWFLSRGQIWLKMLPDGEPIQLTHDPRFKFAPTFSPDGSRLAYSVSEPSTTAWDTVTVPTLGGEPRLLLPNAEGLTWLSRDRVLFSEIKTGIHMAVVTANENRSESRDVYVPEHERAMAHFSHASPDGKWVLVVEMNHTTAWDPCRVVPFDGSSRGWRVGPVGACSAAGWSPDGKWMFVTVATSDGQQLWRQRFPRGEPERLTFGPAKAQGVAVAPDGRSLITSLGMDQTTVWIHDTHGDRQISSVGSAFRPSFSRNGSRVFYLLQRTAADPQNELWAVDLATGRNERLLSGFHITGYDISESGAEAVLAVKPENGRSQIWLASLDRRSAPVRIASGGEDAPYFGPDGHILMRLSDGKANYLLRMNRDGSGRAKVRPDPILNVTGVSPDGHWIAALVPVNDAQASFAQVAIPANGGETRRICSGFCLADWSPDGTHFYVKEHGSGSNPGSSVAIPLPRGKPLPDLPASGVRSVSEAHRLLGGVLIEHSRLAPGPIPATYAYVKTASQRNLFRIPIP